MRSYNRAVLVFYIFSTIAILAPNNYHAKGNVIMRNYEDSIKKVDLENSNKLIIETLEYDSQRYELRFITDRGLLDKIIKGVKSSELVPPEIYGTFRAHNQLLSFYQYDKKLVDLKFFIHKDYPQDAFFKYIFFTEDNKMRLREYIVDEEFYQLLRFVIESTPAEKEK